MYEVGRTEMTTHISERPVLFERRSGFNKVLVVDDDDAPGGRRYGVYFTIGNETTRVDMFDSEGEAVEKAEAVVEVML